MKKRQSSDSGWNIEEALRLLRATIDPYIWEQGQELYKRGAIEDFQVAANGVIQVRVLDPRDDRKFFVTVEKGAAGKIVVRCPCPYRLGGSCRHQVVSLEYLRTISTGAEPEGAPPDSAPVDPAVSSGASGTRAPGKEDPLPGPALYHLFGMNEEGSGVSTCPDGSLLRLVLHTLGSRKRPHRVGLQLFTGTGWTEVRTSDVERWISRGQRGVHPRDALLASYLTVNGEARREVDSEVLAGLLMALAGSDALVDRGGRPLPVVLWPWYLTARLVRGEGQGVSLELSCLTRDGQARPFEEVSVVQAVTPWIQLDSGAFHPLISGAAGPLLSRLQEEDYSCIKGDDLDRLLAEGIKELERLCPGAVEIEPGLIEEVEGVTGARICLEGTPARLSGKLELSYGGQWVVAPETPEPWTVELDGKIQRYPPAGQSISRAHCELESIGFQRSEDGWVIAGSAVLAKVLTPRKGSFVSLELPTKLETLDLVDRVPMLRLTVNEGGGGPASTPTGGGPQRSGIPWLDVSFQLLDGDRELPVDLAALKEAAGENSDGLLQLDDGTVLGMQHAPVRTLMDLTGAGGIPGASATAEGHLRVPLPFVGELMEEQPGREVDFALGVRALIDGLRGDLAPDPRELQSEFQEILRPYQRAAVGWFGQLSNWGLAGILADEMGLGKTVMTLAHFFGREPLPVASSRGEVVPSAREEASGESSTVLVVCPSSLIFNWLDECRRFVPGVRAVGLYGQSPSAREDLIREGADILVTSYALLRRDREALEATELRAVILDEAQHIKNPGSQTAKAAFALRARERWILTGTPIENHLGELWSLFHFLMPGFLGTSADFHSRFREPIARGERGVMGKLHARVKPFLLRRTKAQVLTELPPRIDQVERVPMTEPQRNLYEEYLRRARAEPEVGESPKARFQLLAALTRLRQICCHPRLVVDGKETSGSAAESSELTSGKFELLLELLDECFEEGHRVLLYSQFTSMLDLIEERLEEKGVVRCRLDGSTRDRRGVVNRFATDASIPVFLISLKAGGHGLNLTQADTVILYDPWWNPAAEEQAAARAHRMGQTLPVHVHRLITAGTVEEKILDLQATKRDLAERVVRSEEEALGALSLGDLRDLLT